MILGSGTWAAKRVQRLCLFLCLLCVANWLACGAVALWLGGDAWGGYIESGRYYVGGHGRYAEVSHVAYVYSKIHVVVSIVLLPIGAVAGLIAAIVREHLSHG